MEILSTLHARVEYISVKKCTFKPLSKTETSHSHWGMWTLDTHLIDPSLDQPHSPSHTTARLVHKLLHNDATKSHSLQWNAPNSPPKLPLPLRRSTLPSNTPIPQPTPLSNPNGIQIQSAVLPQYTFQTDRHTDQYVGQATGLFQQHLRSIMLIVSNALITTTRIVVAVVVIVVVIVMRLITLGVGCIIRWKQWIVWSMKHHRKANHEQLSFVSSTKDVSTWQWAVQMSATNAIKSSLNDIWRRPSKMVDGFVFFTTVKFCHCPV